MRADRDTRAALPLTIHDSGTARSTHKEKAVDEKLVRRPFLYPKGSSYAGFGAKALQVPCGWIGPASSVQPPQNTPSAGGV